MPSCLVIGGSLCWERLRLSMYLLEKNKIKHMLA